MYVKVITSYKAGLCFGSQGGLACEYIHKPWHGGSASHRPHSCMVSGWHGTGLAGVPTGQIELSWMGPPQLVEGGWGWA